VVAVGILIFLIRCGLYCYIAGLFSAWCNREVAWESIRGRLASAASLLGWGSFWNPGTNTSTEAPCACIVFWNWLRSKPGFSWELLSRMVTINSSSRPLQKFCGFASETPGRTILQQQGSLSAVRIIFGKWSPKSRRKDDHRILAKCNGWIL
jgi:hypothetical protein